MTSEISMQTLHTSCLFSTSQKLRNAFSLSIIPFTNNAIYNNIRRSERRQTAAAAKIKMKMQAYKLELFFSRPQWQNKSNIAAIKIKNAHFRQFALQLTVKNKLKMSYE